jgi:D-arginine dehydrogenase
LERTGAVHLADAATEARLDAFAAQFAGTAVALEPLDRAALDAIVPGLRAHWTRGLFEPSCANIDVAALHQAYLRKGRAAGAQLILGARVDRIARGPIGWSLDCGARQFQARILVDAAGAWADEIAALAGMAPLGIAPLRRTIVQLEVDPTPPEGMPLVIDAAESFYFKREAGGRLWLSPHDEGEAAACDAAPEELDIAIAIDRLERAVDWRIARVEHKWAGLRSFAPDRLPVYGFDPRAEGFFWFAAQGGFGIQTAPAAARLAAALITGKSPHASVAAMDPARYAPGRLISG